MIYLSLDWFIAQAVQKSESDRESATVMASDPERMPVATNPVAKIKSTLVTGIGQALVRAAAHSIKTSPGTSKEGHIARIIYSLSLLHCRHMAASG